MEIGNQIACFISEENLLVGGNLIDFVEKKIDLIVARKLSYDADVTVGKILSKFVIAIDQKIQHFIFLIVLF